MENKKVNVLKKAIQMLENGFEYDWDSTEMCNCGVVVKALGVSDSVYTAGSGNWIEKTNSGECAITGLKISTIQRELVNAGFTKKDIRELEKLANQDIAKRIGEHINSDNTFVKYSFMDSYLPNGNFKYADKATLIKYLRAWVEILEEEKPKEIPQPKIVYVAVPVTITEQAKEQVWS